MPTNALRVVILSFCGLSATFAYESDIISDITGSASDERRALEIKHEQFWQLVQKAAQDTHTDAHLQVYAEVETALSALPEANDHVRGLLSEALMRLRRADETVLRQAVESSDLASIKLTQGPPPGVSMFSFLNGGQSFLSLAIKRFVGGGTYSEQVSQQIASRQTDMLPALRGAASVTSNVLSDCRLASKLSFDVLKYDIYNKGVPKTPEDIKAAAYKLVDAASQTRHQFSQGIVGMANALATDAKEKHVDPSAKVTQTLMTGLVGFGVKAEEKIVIDF